MLACVGTVQDVTDQKRSESALHESEARIDLALAASGLGWWDVDGPTGKLTVDGRISEMLGYSVDDLARSEFWKHLIDPRDSDRFTRDLTAHLKGDSEAFFCEYRLRHKDGHWVCVEARGKVIERGATGMAMRMVGTLVDVTQRKRLHGEGVELLRRIETLIRESTSGHRASGSDTRAVDGLTKREKQILGMIAEGLSSPEIAARLNVSTHTVGTHRQNLMSKLDLHTAADVTRFAIDHGLLDRS